MNSYIQLAYKKTGQSGHPKHQMACVVVRGGAVVSSAANLRMWGKCCERRALRPNHDYRGATLIVVRDNGGCSRPCKRCQKLIKAAGISKVIFVDEHREIVVERI